MKLFLISLVLLLMLSSLSLMKTAYASAPTAETCSLTTWDLLRIADFYEKKVPITSVLRQSSKAEEAMDDIKTTYKIAEEQGVSIARLNILQGYVSCIRDVGAKESVSSLGNAKSVYGLCMDSSTTNLLILMHIRKGFSLEEIKDKFPQSLSSKIESLYNYSRNYSFDYAVASVASSSQSCIEDAEKTPNK